MKDQLVTAVAKAIHNKCCAKDLDHADGIDHSDEWNFAAVIAVEAIYANPILVNRLRISDAYRNGGVFSVVHYLQEIGVNIEFDHLQESKKSLR